VLNAASHVRAELQRHQKLIIGTSKGTTAEKREAKGEAE
jgi:hypothetical protein